MEKTTHKIYCAGPLFNPKEQEEMQEIAHTLEKEGYEVFLPQRDGLEFAKLFPCLLERKIPTADAQRILNMSIFSLDVFQIMDSDGLILNMNGRVPDEGAMVEAGIAWAHNKVMVVFRNDSRSLIEGNCNPMILGLSDFLFVTSYDKMVEAFKYKFSSAIEKTLLARDRHFEDALNSGKKISENLTSKKPKEELAELLIDLFRERIWQDSEKTSVNYSPTSLQL